LVNVVYNRTDGTIEKSLNEPKDKIIFLKVRIGTASLGAIRVNGTGIVGQEGTRRGLENDLPVLGVLLEIFLGEILFR
jgi:hypothetical protein